MLFYILLFPRYSSTTDWNVSVRSVVEKMLRISGQPTTHWVATTTMSSLNPRQITLVVVN